MTVLVQLRARGTVVSVSGEATARTRVVREGIFHREERRSGEDSFGGRVGKGNENKNPPLLRSSL